MSSIPEAHTTDEWLFGWDDTPRIVSVWADREGRALIWRREQESIRSERERYRPWLFAAHLEDVAYLGASLSRDPESAISVQQLQQPPTVPGQAPPAMFPFLLSARHGKTLERAILDGASRRLGRVVRSLYELDDDYYRVGPVEQYLMSSGRVYFREMSYHDLHRLQFDFETTALDPSHGRIFLAAVRDSRGLATILEAPQPADEARLIMTLLELIAERDPDVIENHNLFGFDLPFLEGRAAAHGIALSLGRHPGPMLLERYEERGRFPGSPGRVRYSVAGRELIDTLDAVRRHDFVARDLPSHRLKDVARHFGIATEDRVYIAGEQVYQTYRNDPERVRRYALGDVEEVDGLSQRLMGAPFALARMAPRRYERLASAGPAMGILEPLLVRAYLQQGAALPYGETQTDLPPHSGGALHLFATGIAEQVVKADIASLYPSLMRRFRIGPACDYLGALLHIVDRVLTLRLEHKAAAKAAVRGSLEAGYHDGMQAGMKLLINSAYGYMGAGRMALFADRTAADQVTSRGRDVLQQVVDGLRAHGVALIEADTDGVYVAVPKGWDEAHERAMVAEVAASLTDGIRLDYEGRYRAMFSHEVKNYALLTYNGQLIMRGVALRSSRAEPFGERFLAQALRFTMMGEVVALRDLFLQTVSNIRQRQLPAADLASRTRLSKSPTEYAASRQREAQYEALIAAGRLQWSLGERVRCFRAQDGTAIWIPDETDDSADPYAAQRLMIEQRRDYDSEYYVNLLVNSYAGRLKKAFTPEDFDQLFRPDEQLGLFDRPISAIRPLRIQPDNVS